MPNLPFRGGSSSTRVQRTVDTLKILLDIAKESADWFPPLKAALGGVNALIKHYEQYKDVKEKAAQLIPWLKKLKDHLAAVTDGIDSEEEERRVELSSSLERIEKRSQALLEKKRIPSFFDKKKDSQQVVDLVDELQTAIVYYQISQQQSIYNRTGKLISFFEMFRKLYQKSPMARGRIETAFARLERLSLGKNDSDAADAQEPGREVEFFTALEHIERKLQEILNRVDAAGHTENDEDVQIVSELMDDIRDAVTDFQAARQHVIYEKILELIDRAEMSVLNSCRRAHGAGYRHGGRNSCLKGTRGTVLDEIEHWAEDFDNSPILWLNGLAGTGKSTIAQTIAERMFANDCLGASFFCSRDFEDRSNLHLVFPTLAFQLAQKYPKFRTSLIALLQSNPDIIHESLQDQMVNLLIEPLQSADISTVIVIDALDECRDEEPESAILLVLGKSASKIPRVKFFITSRPEAHIMAGFRGPLLKELTEVFVLHHVEPRTIDNDIRRFLKHELSELARRRGSTEGWPTDEQLESLCRRAAGFFVYAVATVSFLDHHLRDPSDQLDIIMKSPESTAHEGETELKVYKSLDSLYMSILQESFRKNKVKDDDTVRSVLSAVVIVANSLSPSAISTLTGLSRTSILRLLGLIQSLLVLPEDPFHPVQPFHKSFPDFITDPARCTDLRFYISPDSHIELLLHCLDLMAKSLKKNICSIPNYALNSEVDDLPKRIEDNGVNGGLEYACRSWYKHLVVTEHRTLDVLSALRGFLTEKFVAWLEVLSALGAVGDAARALIAAVKWLNEIQVSGDVDTLLEITTDCLRFVTEFFDVISRSIPHIYHSALSLIPHSSRVRELYGQHIHSPMSRVVTGIPTSWDSCTASAGIASQARHAAWSPCGQFVAVCSTTAIEIRDSNTLEILSTLKLPFSNLFPPRSLVFSPDGRLLACPQGTKMLSAPKLLVWDIGAGVVISGVNVPGLEEIAFSGNRTVVNLQDTFFKGHLFHMYDALNGTQLCKGGFSWSPSPSHRLGAYWTHEGALRFATSFETGGHAVIEIHELQPASHPPSVAESFHVPRYDGKFSFSPASSHASFVTKTAIVILDVRDSRILLQVKSAQSSFNPPGQFSPDGRFFACGTQEPRICVWENRSTDYGPWNNLRPRLLFKGFSFSPTMSSILTWGQEGIQLLNPGNQPTFPSPDGARRRHKRHNHLVAHSTDRAIIVTGRREDRIIKILDALSGTQPRFIDTRTKIRDIRIADDAIYVASSQGLVRWELEAGERGHGVHDATSKITAIDPSAKHLALSHDCSRIAFTVGKTEVFLYDLKARRIVARHTSAGEIVDVQFSPNQDGLRLLTSAEFKHWSFGRNRKIRTLYSLMELEITEGGGFGNATTKLLKDRLLWINLFSHGYSIGSGSKEWVVDLEGNKLLWLPPGWRTKNVGDARWNGNFLALLDGYHPDPVIIQFSP